MRAPRLVVVTLLLALVSSCTAILGLDPLEPYDGGGEAEGGAPIEDDGGPDAPGPSGEDGSVVGEAGVPPCSPDEQPASPVVYVSANAGDGGTPTGSAELPYRTITAAFPQARLVQAKTIAVDEGTYVENVTLESFATPIKIDGAWIRSADGTWRRDCSPERRKKTVLRSTTDFGLRVQGQAAVGVTVSNMTIEARAPASTPANNNGASRYGVFVDNSLLSLENVRVVAPRGDPGGPASPGTNGTPKCDSTDECVATPAAGTNAQNAPPASTFGTFNTNGFAPANGAAGANGGDGTNGTPGGPATSRDDCFAGCEPKPSCEQANPPAPSSSGPGKCGCGGKGGTRGEPGRGGGASIALYVVGQDSFVVVKNSELIASAGGNGSAGGQGGAGGQPTAGVPGQSVSCFEPKCCRCGECPDCGCYGGGNWSTCCKSNAPVNRVLPGGAAGGAGRAGGKGANGGGGAGGPSYTYVPVDGASVLLEASSATYQSGGLGAGGAPNGPNGVHP